jgi:hypothetical protein
MINTKVATAAAALRRVTLASSRSALAMAA